MIAQVSANTSRGEPAAFLSDPFGAHDATLTCFPNNCFCLVSAIISCIAQSSIVISTSLHFTLYLLLLHTYSRYHATAQLRLD
jgi:hypothetical protein